MQKLRFKENENIKKAEYNDALNGIRCYMKMNRRNQYDGTSQILIPTAFYLVNLDNIRKQFLKFYISIR